MVAGSVIHGCCQEAPADNFYAGDFIGELQVGGTDTGESMGTLSLLVRVSCEDVGIEFYRGRLQSKGAIEEADPIAQVEYRAIPSNLNVACNDSPACWWNPRDCSE